ncbi:MAG TPA: hypothetical protein VFE57_13270 [Cyclobacteriaceae bacterium]|nr:hypothetical protein [Cyclobacteriaceae bacterium]
MNFAQFRELLKKYRQGSLSDRERQLFQLEYCNLFEEEWNGISVKNLDKGQGKNESIRSYQLLEIATMVVFFALTFTASCSDQLLDAVNNLVK